MENQNNVEKFELVELEDRLEFFSCSGDNDGDGGTGPGDENSCDNGLIHECEEY